MSCEEEYLGLGAQFGAEARDEFVPLISLSFINNIIVHHRLDFAKG